MCVWDVYSLGAVAIAAVAPRMGYESGAEDEENGNSLSSAAKKGSKVDLAQERVLHLVSLAMAIGLRSVPVGHILVGC